MFNKTSQNVFTKKDVCVSLLEDDTVDILERESEDNECSTAQYEVQETSYKSYTFTLVHNWSERELPIVINGETEFRRMINNWS